MSPEDQGTQSLTSVLQQAGKSQAEVSSTVRIDRVDSASDRNPGVIHGSDQSPVYSAIWQNALLRLFASHHDVANLEPPPYAQIMLDSVNCVSSHFDNGTLFGEDGKLSPVLLSELADAGYFRMLVPSEYGGVDASITDFMRLLTDVTTKGGSADVAGYLSINECIGAVNPLRFFGSAAAREKWLPKMARGEIFTAFALTEPNAGIDVTSLRSTAVLDGDEYVVNCNKLFISNLLPGRTIALVVVVEGKQRVLIVDLPQEENEQFQLARYDLHALKHLHNFGLLLKGFRVPKENMLDGDGLAILYHGLNRGRIAVCAYTAGEILMQLQAMLPWAHHRITYGKLIAERELIKGRLARTAALYVGAVALRESSSWLIDQGYRAELECMAAKVFSSEALLEVTTLLAPGVHGGRSLFKGHIVGDTILEALAANIYEGPNSALVLACFLNLTKRQVSDYLAPIAVALKDNDIKKFQVFNPVHLWKVRKPLGKMLPWAAQIMLRTAKRSQLRGIDSRLKKHVDFALIMFAKLPKLYLRNMITYQLKLLDEQDIVEELSRAAIKTMTILATALYAAQQQDEGTIAAADVLCSALRRELTFKPKTRAERKAIRHLADLIIAGQFKHLEGVKQAAIMQPYENISLVATNRASS